MGAAGTVIKRVNHGMNAMVAPLVRSPRLHRLVSRNLAMVTYTGRRSGQTFSTPVLYTRDGDEVSIRVGLAAEKRWWRNFEGGGAGITLRLRGVDHSGHGVVARDDMGRVWVKVRLSA
jgi:hypothetical protein